MTIANTRPRVILDPNFRTVESVFSAYDLKRLYQVADVVWGRDDRMPDELFESEIVAADAVVFGHWRRSLHVLEQAGPQLRALLEIAGGHEHAQLDYETALGRGLHVGSCAPAFATAVAEFGLALALTMVRGIAGADAAMRRRDEAWLLDGNLMNRSLIGATVGFIGVGGIARELIRLLEPFGVRFVGYDPPLGDTDMRRVGVEPAELSAVFDTADIIFVVAAPTPGSDALVGSVELERLDAHQSLVLLSRASLVDWEALLSCSAQQGFRFATDVYPSEPVPLDDTIRDHPNAVLTPHLAGAFDHALHTIGSMVVDDLVAIFGGRQPYRMQYLTNANRAGLVQAPKASGWTEHRHADEDERTAS